MHNNGVTQPESLRVELSNIESPTSRKFKVGMPKHVDIPSPKNGSTYEPLEIWDVFYNLKNKEGDKCYSHLKLPLIKYLTKKTNGKSLVPLSESGLIKHACKPKFMVSHAWHVVGRKRLAVLNDVNNVMFEKAKSNPGRTEG